MAHLGRNDPCPCGSGKKHKRCCGSVAAAPPEGQSSGREIGARHRFDVKGKKAEAVVHALAERTFFTDWCFPNPKWPDKGKNEVCDLLVVFGDVAIFWAVTDLKLGPDGLYNSDGVAHNVRQLGGASRHLLELKRKFELQNARRTPEDFDPESIKRVFLVSVLMGKGEAYSKMFDEVRGRPVHVVSGASLPILLGELDTVADFVAYLEAKEELFRTGRTRILMEGGEEELLASYLTMRRSFQRFKNKDRVVIEAGSWNHYNQRPEVKSKREEDEVSRGWDHLIDIAHSMRDLGSADRERLSRELARPTRFHRRCLAKAMLDGMVKAHRALTPSKIQRNLTQIPDLTVYFQYTHPGMAPDLRDRILTFGQWVARDLRPKNKTVLGVSWTMDDEPFVGRLGLFHVPRWTAHDRSEAKRLQRECGIFVEPRWRKIREDEYPST